MILATLLLWGLNGANAYLGEAEVGDILMAFTGCMVASLILRTYPGHRIGWLLLGIGLLWAYEWFGMQYAYYAYFTRPQSLPAANLIFWLSGQTWGIGFSLVVWLVLLFPTGHLLSRGWRWVGIVASGAACSNSLAGMIVTWRYRGPLLFELERLLVEDAQLAVIRPYVVALLLLAFCSLFPALLALILRMRRTTGVERQQMKWFLFGTAFLASLMLLMSLLVPIGTFNSDNQSGIARIWDLLYLIAPSLLPAAIGVAILRYRLYDIDILIRRTLIYSTLTLLLALVYWGSVVVLQALFQWMTGQAQNPLITVISTLALAALFAPLRRRIQKWIDQRFYRRSYDAALVLAAFGEAVRNETDLNRLNESLIRVVQETMQPTHTSLWLRQPQDEER